MAWRSAGVHRVPTGVGTARRAFGGMLMALGAAAAAFLALLSAWLATELLGDIVRSASIDPAEIWAPLKVTASVGLAAMACALLAWLGWLILGPRPPV